MAVSLKEISKWLDNDETKHHVNDEENIILFGFSSDENIYGVRIKLKENGELLQVYSNKIIGEGGGNLKIKKHKYLSLIFQHMLNINYNEKFGTWEFDPSDGEIRFGVETVLEDSIMTEKQFNRIINHILNSNKGFEQIMTIAKTGELPKDNVENRFASMMAEILLSSNDRDIDATLKSLEDMVKKEDITEEDGI